MIRSNSSDRQCGHRISTVSSDFITRISKHSLHWPHLNSKIGICGSSGCRLNCKIKRILNHAVVVKTKGMFRLREPHAHSDGLAFQNRRSAAVFRNPVPIVATCIGCNRPTSASALHQLAGVFQGGLGKLDASEHAGDLLHPLGLVEQRDRDPGATIGDLFGNVKMVTAEPGDLR